MPGTAANAKKIVVEDMVIERWVAKLVARLLAPTTLWFRIQAPLKSIRMGDIRKGMANTF
jgi:hypothetical protein